MGTTSFLGVMVNFFWATRLYSLAAAEATLHLWLKPSCGTVYSLTHQDSPPEPTHRTEWKGMIKQNQKLYDVDFVCFFKKKTITYDCVTEQYWIWRSWHKHSILFACNSTPCSISSFLPPTHPFLSCPEVIFVCVVAEWWPHSHDAIHGKNRQRTKELFFQSAPDKTRGSYKQEIWHHRWGLKIILS